MSADKTPLQAVVCVICDALCELPRADQSRALEAVAITLGLRQSVKQLPSSGALLDLSEDDDTYQFESTPPVRPPMVQVTMMSGLPVRGRPGQAFVSVMPVRRNAASRGGSYVHRIR